MSLLSRAFRGRDASGHIAGYRIIEPLTEGASSALYVCEDPRRDEPVLVKVLSPHSARIADKLSRRLGKEWEGERACRLVHPNIVRTHTCGRDGRTYYIVMEYLTGGSLDELLRTDSPRLDGRRLQIAMAAGRGVAYVHELGIIHRDICPRNILLHQDGTPKLIDFGVAAARGDVIRNTGMRTGRPSYMAPELVRSNLFNERTDIYSFGITLYEILAGQLPFRPGDRYARMQQHLSVEPVPLSKVCATVTPQLESVVLRTISKDPRERPRTMDELLRDLQACSAGAP